MGKQGKRKNTDRGESEHSEENGNKKNEKEASEAPSGSSGTVARSSGGDKKQKAAAAAKLNAAAAGSGAESSDSDNTPLNGNGPPKKKRKLGSTGKAKAGGKTAGAKKSEKIVDDDGSGQEDDNGEESAAEYEVEAIVGHKTVRGLSYYCVRWKGYKEEDDTWEAEADLSCNDLIREYQKAKKSNNHAGGSAAGGKRKKAGKEKSSKATPKSKLKQDKSAADPNKEWAVERIIDFVQDDEQGGLYRIRWKGFGAQDDTWEPETNLSCHVLIEKFKKGLEQQIDAKELRESPRQTKRLVNETLPRSNFNNKIGRSSKRSAAKTRVFYGEE